MPPTAVAMHEREPAPARERAPASAQERVVDMYEKRYHDVTTLGSEMLDGNMQTTFVYEYDDNVNELYAQDGRSLGEIFDKSEIDAEVIARKDPRLTCEIRRRGLGGEKGEYNDMIAMAQGHGPNTLVVVSDAPAELLEWKEDLLGYSYSRMKTMLRVICRLPNGNIQVTSQSLDRSDRDGLEAIYDYFGMTPEPGELLGQRIPVEVEPFRQSLMPDELRRVYDKRLEDKFGVEFHAGRTPADLDNTHKFVCQQNDLVHAFMEKDGTDPELYGFIAALDNRWKARKASQGLLSKNQDFITVRSGLAPEAEMHHLGQRAIQEGKSWSGCGVTLSAEDELEALGYGIKEKEKKEDTTMKCVNCPKCSTFHEEVKLVKGKYTCKNEECGYEVRA